MYGSHNRRAAAIEALGGGGGAEQAYYVEYNGTTSQLNAASGASLDNLHAGAMTFETWYRCDTLDGTSRRIAMKTKWLLAVASSYGLRMVIYANDVAYLTDTGADEFAADEQWHHLAVTYDDNGDRKVRIYIDGSEIASYAAQQATSGTADDDSAENLLIGNDAGKGWDGAIGWLRISDSVRYSGSFTPLARCSPPETDASTVLLLRMLEGSGNPQDSSGNDNHGTLTDGTWYTCDGVPI